MKLYIHSCAFALALLIAMSKAWGQTECPPQPFDSEQTKQEAKKWFDKGTNYVVAGEYSSAAEAFQCSNELVAHPATLLNLAKATHLSGNLKTAVETYTLFLKLYPDHPKFDFATSQIKRLDDSGSPSEPNPKTVPTTPTSNPETNLVAPPTQTKQPASPPKPAATTVTLPEKTPSPPMMPKRSNLFPIGLGLIIFGSAGILTGVGFQAASTYNYFRTKDDIWLSEFYDYRRNAHRFQAAASATFAVAGAALLTGTILLLIEHKRVSKHREHVRVEPTGAGIRLRF